MVKDYDARSDVHAKEGSSNDALLTLDVEALRHNIMRSYLEVSEWLGDGALQYGSHNGFVSRKMSLCWLFNSIRALINWKLNNQEKYGEVSIRPLVVNDGNVKERFLSKSEMSTQGWHYNDYLDLD